MTFCKCRGGVTHWLHRGGVMYKTGFDLPETLDFAYRGILFRICYKKALDGSGASKAFLF